MPGITNPAEEYFKDGLWGWVTNAWKKLVATAGGALHIQFAGQETDVEVKQTTPADLTPGVCGWSGSAWQKLPMVWGYSDRWSEYVEGAAIGAGSADANTEAVGAGYVYVVEVISISHDAGVAKDIVVHLVGGGNVLTLFVETGWATDVYKTIYLRGVLKKDDYIHAGATTPGAGKKVKMYVWGYKMLIGE